MGLFLGGFVGIGDELFLGFLEFIVIMGFIVPGPTLGLLEISDDMWDGLLEIFMSTTGNSDMLYYACLETWRAKDYKEPKGDLSFYLILTVTWRVLILRKTNVMDYIV